MKTRRSPRLVPFLSTGVIAGFFVGGLFAMRATDSGGYSVGSQIGYLGLFGAMIGGLLSALAFLFFDRH